MIGLIISAVLSGTVASPVRVVGGNDASHTPQTSWACNAPAGSSDKNGIAISSLVIAGSIQIEKVRENEQWAPVASFNFRPERGAQRFAGVSLYMRPGDTRKLYVRATGFKRDGREIGSIPLTGPIDVRIALDQTGTLDVKAGTVTATIHGARFQPTVGEVSCSSGQFLFSNLSGNIINY